MAPRFAFGFGESYTKFNIDIQDSSVEGKNYITKVKVTNVGTKYSGKSVIQLYYSAPKSKVAKAFQNLGS